MTLINDARGNLLTAKIISAAEAVYRSLGGGLREEVYKKALFVELENRGMAVQWQVQVSEDAAPPTPIPASTDRPTNPIGLDLLVENRVLVRVKARPRLLTQDESVAQVSSHLQVAQKPIALLLNFGRASVYFKRILQPKQVDEPLSRV